MQLAVDGAVSAPVKVAVTDIAVASARRMWLVVLAFALAVALVAVQSPPSVQAASEAGRVTNFAAYQLGKGYSYGATGLRRYDCSGLVYRTFYQTGLLNRIGGSRKTARGYFDWFRSRGLASRSNPRRGDLIVWGYGKHIGIYTGDGKAISSLVTGVKRHSVGGISVAFTAYLHVRLSR